LIADSSARQGNPRHQPAVSVDLWLQGIAKGPSKTLMSTPNTAKQDSRYDAAFNRR
jgi:hypothetical protein